MTIRARARAVWVVLGLVPAAGGCGYVLQGGNTFLPQHIKVIAVTPFENRTNATRIEQFVTEEITEELAKRGRYRVLNAPEGADALLEGVVSDYRTTPVQFTAEGRGTRFEAVVTIRATLRDLVHDELLWSQSELLFREQYDVPSAGTFADVEEEAMASMARGAAGTVVTSLLEGF